jgi:hypothetical protein
MSQTLNDKFIFLLAAFGGKFSAPTPFRQKEITGSGFDRIADTARQSGVFFLPVT